MGTTLLRLVTAIAFVVVLGASSRADAKGKIPIVFQTGQTMFESGPLPAPYDKDSALLGATAGYVCDVTGVFWSYITIDDCQPAAIRGNTFDTSADLAAAVRAAYPEPTIPFWAEHGWKLMAGGLVFVIVLFVFLGLRSSDDDEEVAATGRGGDKPQTQFHMAVVEPQLAKDRTAAFEGSTARPSAPDHQPKFVEEIRRGSQPAIAPLAAEAQRDSQPAFAPMPERVLSQPASAPERAPSQPAFAPNRGGSQPAVMNAERSAPITGYEPTAPLRPEQPRPRTDVVPPPIARPHAMVMAPHLAQPSPQAVAFIAPQPAPMAPAQPMRQSPPSMPPAMGMPQPAYAHVHQPVAPTVAISTASQSGHAHHPQRDINAYMMRPSQYQRAQRASEQGADAWPRHDNLSLGAASQPPLAHGSQQPAPSYAHGTQPVAQLSQPTPNAYGTQPVAQLAPPDTYRTQPMIAHVHPASVQPAGASLPMPQAMAPQAMSAQAMQMMLSRQVNHNGPSTKPAIAVPMPERPARPSIQPLAHARAAVAQPRAVTARPLPVLPAVPPPAAPIQSGPPEMPPPIGYVQAAPARAKRPSEPAALPVERRFEDAQRAQRSPIALAPASPQFARSPGQATRPPAHVVAPHLMARGSQPTPTNAANVGRAPTEPAQLPADDEVDAQDTSLRMDEFVDEAATVLSVDAPAVEDGATDVMDALREEEVLAALAPLQCDGPTNHDGSSQKRARTDYNESRRMARGSHVAMHGEPVDLHAPIAPELLRATIKIDDPKPHPYVTTRFRRG